MGKFCEKCGKRYSDKSEFCSKCGISLKKLEGDDESKVKVAVETAASTLNEAKEAVVNKISNGISDEDKVKAKKAMAKAQEKLKERGLDSVEIERKISSFGKIKLLAIILIILSIAIGFFVWYNQDEKVAVRYATTAIEQYAKITVQNPKEDDVDKFFSMQYDHPEIKAYANGLKHLIREGKMKYIVRNRDLEVLKVENVRIEDVPEGKVAVVVFNVNLTTATDKKRENTNINVLLEKVKGGEWKLVGFKPILN